MRPARSTALRQWETATDKEIAFFSGHTGLVCVVTFAAADSSVLTGGNDRPIRVWRGGEAVALFPGAAE